MVELWERAVNILTKELSGDERWCYPCWIQSEPAQGSSSPQGRQGNCSAQLQLLSPKQTEDCKTGDLFLQKQEETVTSEAVVYYFYYKHARRIKTS